MEETTEWKAAGRAVADAVTAPDVQPWIDRAKAEVLAGLGDPVPCKERPEWLRRYWALGPHKWREAIDGRHFEFGPAAYDHCLHGGNGGHVEPGFLGAMWGGFEVIEAALGCRTTVELWYSVHRVAMSHTSELDRGMAGQVRSIVNYVEVPPSWEGSPEGITAVAKAEIAAMDPAVCELVPNADGGGFNLQFLAVSQETMFANLQAYIDEFYRSLDEVRADPASTAVDLVRPIARLQQAIYRMEPSKDGNARTANLLLNKHLVEVGLHPALLPWPDGAEVYEHERWLREVLVGMQWWRESVKVTAPGLAETLEPIEVPPWPSALAEGEGEGERMGGSP